MSARRTVLAEVSIARVTFGLPPNLVRVHEGGWVFTNQQDRDPINPSTDCRAWKAILKRAGVRDARLHDARHTAASVLLVLGRAGADGDGGHGLVDDRNGLSLPACNRSDPPRCGLTRRRSPPGSPLGPRSGQTSPKLRPLLGKPPRHARGPPRLGVLLRLRKVVGQALPWRERRRRDLNPREG
jgi:hypothetical protein